jgi:hypothetical protein
LEQLGASPAVHVVSNDNQNYEVQQLYHYNVKYQINLWDTVWLCQIGETLRKTTRQPNKNITGYCASIPMFSPRGI